MLNDIFLISITTSIVILLLLLTLPILNKRYSAKWRYFIWLIIAIRLIINIRFELPKAPVHIPVSDHTIVFKTEGASVGIVNNNIAKTDNTPKSNVNFPIISLNDLLFTLWILGAVSFVSYHIVNYFIFKKRIAPHLQKQSEFIYTCDKLISPVLIGFFKPTILLPDIEYSPVDLDIIIKHEMTHFKRHDIWYKLILIIANAIHWFNPLVYLMVRQANRDLEYSCDDIVIKEFDMEYKKKYSLAILKSMEMSEHTSLSTYLSGGSNGK